MRTLYTTLLFLITSSFALAQGVNNIQIIPSSPTSTDVVKAVVSTTTSTSSCWLTTSSQNTVGLTHNITGFHCSGNLLALCNSSDTFTLGVLTAGTHTVNYEMYLSVLALGQTQCTSFVSGDSMSINFNVTNSGGNLPIQLHPPGDHSLCEGDSMFYHTDPLAGATYEWYFNGNLISGANTHELYASDSGFYHVKVFANGDSGTSATSLLSVYPNPNTTLQQAGDIIYTTTNAMIYQWFNLQSGPIIGANNSSYFVTQDGDYFLHLLSAQNCQGTSDTLYVELIDAELQPDEDQELCEHDSLQLSVTPSDTNHQYQWIRNGLPIAGATMPQYMATDSGIYQAAVSISLSTDTSETLTVELVPAPTPTITQSGFTLTSSTAVSYQWYDLSGMLAGETGQSFTPTVSGAYYVEVTYANGCTAISDAVPIDPIGISQPNGYGSMQLIHNSMQVEARFDAAFQGRITMVDLLGNVIAAENFQGQIWKKESAGLASGVYMVKAESVDGHAFVSRILVH